MKSFHSAAENERFTAAALCCCQNLKYRNFTLSSDYVKEMYLNAYGMSAARAARLFDVIHSLERILEAS